MKANELSKLIGEKKTDKKEAMSDEDVLKVIQSLIDTNFSKDNESQGKAVQLLRGIAFSDSPVANNFMQEFDKWADGLKADDFK